jgi:hypothetical protein
VTALKSDIKQWLSPHHRPRPRPRPRRPYRRSQSNVGNQLLVMVS